MNKKGEVSNTGIVMGLIGGIAFLIIASIIAFTIVGILDGSGIIPQGSYQKVNESDLNGAIVPANTSGFNVAGVTDKRNAKNFVLKSCWSEYNQSNGSAVNLPDSFGGYNVSLTSANCTLSSSGNLSSGTPLTYNFPNVSIWYTYSGDSPEILTASNLTSNLSSGTYEIAEKVPTILLISAVILILGILAVLIEFWRRMRLGGGGSL